MGGRSGQSLSRGIVSGADYNSAAKKDLYQSSFNGNENAKTLNAYAERGFYVNYNIRDGTVDDTDSQYMKNLDKALSGLPTDKGSELYRGVNLPTSQFEKIAVGGELKFEGYTSTTKNRSKVEDFMAKNPSSDNTPTIFKIVSHNNGKSIEQFSNIKSEREVLFKRNTSWSVLSKEGNVITIKQI